MAADVVTNVASTIGAAGILAGVGYLRGISARLKTIADKQFSDELHIIAHDLRLNALEGKHA